MSERISRLCDELRIKLHSIDRRLEALKSNGSASFDKTQDALESQLDRVEQRIYDNRISVKVANVRVNTWLAHKKDDFQGMRTPANERDRVSLLGAHADDAEVYAIAVFALAAAAADEATRTVLQALLAESMRFYGAGYELSLLESGDQS